MTAYHCEKLCSGPCCAPLQWALEEWSSFYDGAKLAELGAMALRARGFADTAHFDDDFALTSQFRIRVQDDGEIVCVVWRIEGTHKLQCVRCTLPQFRALLARIMATSPDESSREQCERMIRGES